MITTTTAREVTEFRTAVAGVDIDWVRTDEGFGPASMLSCGDDRLALSAGGLDFSAILHTVVPHDHVVLQLLTHAPSGMTWCGNEGRTRDLRLYGPNAHVSGTVPAGSRAITVVASLDSLIETADSLDAAAPTFGNDAAPLAQTAETLAFAEAACAVRDDPATLELADGSTRLLETAARVLASSRHSGERPSPRGFDSRGIVAAAIDNVTATGNHQPTISELCRVAMASEGRLRHAFVEVVGLPPNRYFQVRVLSLLRDELLAADPATTTVTAVSSSFGLTQFGRVAGRYRQLFGETPRVTLLRHERRIA